MEIDEREIIEDLRPYYSISAMEKILKELYFNAYRTLKSVYLFRHFEEYEIQLRSNRNEDKKDVYWNTLYFEKLIDYVKISIAFETFNKAILLENGYLVHKIKKKDSTRTLCKKQNEGNPVLIDKFKEVANLNRRNRFTKYYYDELTSELSTISYSTTLNENYQRIIQLEKDLLYRLKEINKKRNRAC